MIEMISFILFVVISSFIINGWYEITRYGKIFSFWSKFWQHYTQVSDETIPEYRFPEWVRNPISECIICFASIYGSIIFWTTYYFQQQKLFLGYSLIEVILIWIAYEFCLTCSNYIVHKKLK